MGLERVDRLTEDFDIAVEGKAFLLRPDIPKEGKTRTIKPEESTEHLSEPLKSYAEEAGLIMRRSPFTPYTMYALEATEYAKEQGQFDPVHRAFYKAFWEDRKNIGSFDVIEEVIRGCELNWPELKDRLESRHYEETITNQFQEGVNLGVNGIPGFLIGNILFTGARPYSLFKTVMGKVLEQEAAD